MKTTTNKVYTSLPFLLIGIIAVCSFLSAYGMSFLGDDLNHGILTREKFPHWYQLPLAIPYQWLTGNGRFGDMAGNILLAVAPMWLLAALSAVFESLLYLMVIKISFPDKEDVAKRLIVAAVVMFAFPWWDSFFLFVCRINYVWTTALTLFVLWVALLRKGCEFSVAQGWLIAPLALMAGWGHEAVGMPVVAGMIVYFLINKNYTSLPFSRRIIIIAFTLGSFLSITSPCSYSRLGGDFQPDDTAPVLLAKSSFIAIIFLLMLAGACISKRGREEVGKLLHTPWAVFAVGALTGMLFVVVGGVVGRSGFFSQTYALIALAIMSRKLFFRSNGRENTACHIAAVAIFLATAAHEIGVCAYQMEGNRQLKECLSLYRQSADGVVFASPMQRNQFPWWTLYKNKACIDNDDFWYKKTYDMRHGHNEKHYRLLPVYLKDFKMKEGAESMVLDNGYVTTQQPASTNEDNIISVGSTQYTVVEFLSEDGDSLYYVSPRIVDPGDR